MKTLLITGGTGGLGTVVVEHLRREYDCRLVKADLTSEDEAARALGTRAYGLVHLVGGFTTGDDAASWSQMLSLNLLTAVNAIRAAAPHLEDGGRIVAIGAYASISKPEGMPAYVVSKSAFNTVIELTARELKSRHITVNAILPVTLDDDLKRRVARTIAFLLSDEGAGTSGALLPALS
ncbi:MAG TPA: SDR family NAD(P)-dependent oxidoreductase [Thermoanaerobaculia bacterium]